MIEHGKEGSKFRWPEKAKQDDIWVDICMMVKSQLCLSLWEQSYGEREQQIQNFNGK